VFEAFIGQGTPSLRRRRLAGHAIAIGLHALAITTAAQLARAPRAPIALPAPHAVPVHLGLTLSQACLRRAPAPAHALAAAAATPPAKPKADPAPRSRRHPMIPGGRPLAAAAALPLREPTPMSDVVSPAPTSDVEPTPAAQRPASGTIDGAVRTSMATGMSAGALAPVSPAPRPAPRFLPEPLAQQQKIAGEPPDFPASLATGGATFVIHARICVGPDGHVDRVELLRTAHPTLDGNVVSAVGRWRYRPLVAGGIPVPFCTLARFEFRAT
jgi:hypothetical protein